VRLAAGLGRFDADIEIVGPRAPARLRSDL